MDTEYYGNLLSWVRVLLDAHSDKNHVAFDVAIIGLENLVKEIDSANHKQIQSG